jgi:hypothetical protein
LQRQNDVPAEGKALQVPTDGAGAAAVAVTVTVGAADGEADWAVGGSDWVVSAGGAVVDGAAAGEAGWRLDRGAALLALWLGVGRRERPVPFGLAFPVTGGTATDPAAGLAAPPDA